jgi:hypothetical protein
VQPLAAAPEPVAPAAQPAAAEAPPLTLREARRVRFRALVKSVFGDAREVQRAAKAAGVAKRAAKAVKKGRR